MVQKEYRYYGNQNIRCNDEREYHVSLCMTGLFPRSAYGRKDLILKKIGDGKIWDSVVY